MRIGLVVPHIFMQDALLRDVIFAPAQLAISLAEGLQLVGHDVTLYSPGTVSVTVDNKVADMSEFESELSIRGYGYTELLKKHPLTFATLARQVQSNVIASAYRDANEDKLDIVHIYTNEEDIALQFAEFCSKPVVFTHHDPFSLTIGYKRMFPHYKQLPFIAMSEAQKRDMPADTNWLATVMHGINAQRFSPGKGDGGYVAFIGRIISSKGVHHAINAVNQYNSAHPSETIRLKIAGKYYQDTYFQEFIEPMLNENIVFVGFIHGDSDMQDFLGGAQATLIPSVFEEPFGMVAIESMACATPILALDSGALPELVTEGVSGYIAKKGTDQEIADRMSDLLPAILGLDRLTVRKAFEKRFELDNMIKGHVAAYQKAIG